MGSEENIRDTTNIMASVFNIDTNNAANISTNNDVIIIDTENTRMGIGINSPKEALDISGNLRITSKIYPQTNFTGSIGSSTQNWNSGYFKNLYIDTISAETITAKTISADTMFIDTLKYKIANEINVVGNLVPQQTDKYNLGYLNMEWNTGYFNNITTKRTKNLLSSNNIISINDTAGTLWCTHTLRDFGNPLFAGGSGEYVISKQNNDPGTDSLFAIENFESMTFTLINPGWKTNRFIDMGGSAKFESHLWLNTKKYKGSYTGQSEPPQALSSDDLRMCMVHGDIRFAPINEYYDVEGWNQILDASDLQTGYRDGKYPKNGKSGNIVGNTQGNITDFSLIQAEEITGGTLKSDNIVGSNRRQAVITDFSLI